MTKVIKVENLSKAYQLGDFGTGTISHDLERFWARIRGKEDPFLKIGEVNDRTQKGTSDIVWSLKDINFDIKQGDSVGIIGRNGAGKSTLLKVLSRVTSPTTGSVKIKGRIASLLEVGTGFHPELTGRENIYLNGAILGMRKTEIKRKFDEIVDFAGIERYVDTPVKRYSSGMYVRLAFAIAAHLESEILIVDEVLAVGDAEFQKKCLGKMNDLSKGEGRTVLFVSHNMDAVSRLCNKAMLLNMGNIELSADTDKVIKHYMYADFGTTAYRSWDTVQTAPGNKFVILKEIKIIDEKNALTEIIEITNPITIQVTYEILIDDFLYTHGINLYDETGVHILSSHDRLSDTLTKSNGKGTYTKNVTIPGNLLTEGYYKISFAIMSYTPYIIHFHEMDLVGFTIVDSLTGNSVRGEYGGYYPGIIRPDLLWF